MRYFRDIAVVALTFGATVKGSSAFVKRDAATIQNVLNGISSQIEAVSSAVNAFSGDPQPLQTESTKLLDLLKSGITTVTGTSDLDQTGALQISTFVQGLSGKTDTVVNDLIAKKDALCSAGQGPTVLQNLQDQRTSSSDLAKAITSKVPPNLQAVAATLSGSIDTALGKGVDAYSSGCAGGSSGPSSSSSGASSPPSTTATTQTSVVVGTSSSTRSAPAQQTTNAASSNNVAAHLVGAAALALLL